MEEGISMPHYYTQHNGGRHQHATLLHPAQWRRASAHHITTPSTLEEGISTPHYYTQHIRGGHQKFQKSF
ncbi:hypothetical protein BgiBS90_006670 [Biomphalaria glabrata]|nr:hypothetical protein BgiBS90_006670 [Biomphalaria glabrata]